MILFIDNYDSFTYNLVNYFGQLTPHLRVYRNDRISVSEIEKMQPTGIVISPGPGTPDSAGISLEVVRRLGNRIPVLGICLGHQCIAQEYGAEVIRATDPVHGKVSLMQHFNDTLFSNIPQTFPATRYHSLIVNRRTLPTQLQVIAQTSDGVIMALRHRHYPVIGLQFHPESILTTHGMQILKNWFHGIQSERMNK